jgi:hypothetical protein
MAKPDFVDIERRLLGLLDSLAAQLTDSERREVTDFIDVGEYGLALETLCAVLVEERKRIGLAAFDEIVGLHASMEVEPGATADELRRQIM